MARKDNSSKEHSEIMSLLGEKLALMKTITHINKEMALIDKKLENIRKKEMFSVLKGQHK